MVIINVFASLDLFFFYIYFEGIVIPMFFLIVYEEVEVEKFMLLINFLFILSWINSCIIRFS
jgi:NADH:ubiquinone oxidoreductase subunit 4 (subunit M)